MVNRKQTWARIAVVAGCAASWGALGAGCVGDGNEAGFCMAQTDCPSGQQCGANNRCGTPMEASVNGPVASEAGVDGAATDSPSAAEAVAPTNDDGPSDGAPAATPGPDACGADCVAPVEAGLDASDGAVLHADASDRDAEPGPDACGPPCDGPSDADAAPADADAAPLDSAPDGPDACSVGSLQCDETGAFVESCQPDGGWALSVLCEALCVDGGCEVPPSCQNGSPLGCGPHQDKDCCASRTVPSGAFVRSANYDPNSYWYTGNYCTFDTCSATVSQFSLDVYEVTVGRFRNFVNTYDINGTPAAGAGRNLHNRMDLGWQTSWNKFLPATANELKSDVSTYYTCTQPTWADSIGANENLPIVCVDWYIAFAFCIWDGGRLPTEAEWNYAAAGGSDQRVFPWSDATDDNSISAGTNVNYQAASIGRAGLLSAGNGKWGHSDLAGNAEEWVLDSYADTYATNCADCGDPDPGATHSIRGGNFATVSWDQVTAAARNNLSSGYYPTSGVRCARDIP